MTSATLQHPEPRSASPACPVNAVTLRLVDHRGRTWQVSLPVAAAGEAVFEGAIGLLRFEASLRAFPELQRVRVEVTVHNARRAKHAGGLWDLGDPGSVLVRELSLEVPVADASYSETNCWGTEWIESPGGEIQTTEGPLEIYQESSGGENWDSRNHINRDGRVPMELRGYRVRAGIAGNADRRLDATRGERANPVVAVVAEDQYVACAVEEFWEQFPSAIEVAEGVIRTSFWPRQFPDLHELQAGEQNTRIAWLQFGDADGAPWRALEEVHDPALLNVDREQFISSKVAPFLPTVESETRQDCQTLLREALEGEQSFFAKREAIDEYGWRNFGDAWADHEEAHCADPRPVISHFNNQYDLLSGLLIQYVATADIRWWRLADPLARHILDIDIYHTDRDKPAYNGGLFWHTNHYHDAGRCTHRTYSASMLGKRMPSAGGGPSNEHNYATGLLLYYKLTGNRRARRAVLGLADWVIAMDDGRRHVLSVLSPSATGAASSTAMAEYHGPGRGAGNSINVLLDGWLTNGDDKYLAKVEELIQRTIHPADDLASRELGNAELRWSYTVHLQAIFRFLEIAKGRDELKSLRAYAGESLLQYARWMAENESFYLDSPEQLEFPTETWAAQDLRKGVVLWMAALYSNGDERQRFIKRGQTLLDGAWKRLMGFQSRTCTRPLALVLQQCCLETYLAQRLRDESEHRPVSSTNFGVPDRFQPQRTEVMSRAKSIVGAFALLPHIVNPLRWVNALRQSWAAERIRKLGTNAGDATLRRKTRS